jgi:hypothetical protein
MALAKAVTSVGRSFFHLLGFIPPEKRAGKVVIEKDGVSFEWCLDRREHHWLYISQYSERTGRVAKVIHESEPGVTVIE